LKEKNELTLNELFSSEDLSEENKNYIAAVYNGVADNFDYLMKFISENAEGFSAERIYRVDMGILLLAAYEIFFMDEIPYKVSCNEAVELAKVFSTDKSPAYINGVLAGLIKEHAKENTNG